MASIIDDFKLKFPEFDAGKVEQLLPQLIDVSSCIFRGSYENECDKQAILYLLAHLLYMDLNSGSGAPFLPVASTSVGDVSESFANYSTSEMATFFMTSRYGQIYLMLTRKNIGARVV